MRGHKAREHAVLSASGANQWLNCTPSVRLSEHLPDTTSDYAREGTLAHEFCEIELLLALGRVTKRKYNATIKKLKQNKFFAPEMLGYTDDYVSFVLGHYNNSKSKYPGTEIHIEKKLDLTGAVPESFGTGDTVIRSDTEIIVIDFKYGKGVPVSAENNPQLMLYGFGAFESSFIFDIRQIKVIVFQPRLQNISIFDISTENLLNWVDSIVKPRAKLAFEGKGKLNAGTHCKWCKLKATCPELTRQNLELAKYEFAEPQTLTDSEVLQVYEKSKLLVLWANAVADYLLEKAMEGHKWPGYKLVEGRSNRKWGDPEKVLQVLKDMGFNIDAFSIRKLNGIQKVMSVLPSKEHREKLSEYLIKPPGKPTLVAESDKRPALGNDQVRQDFS